MLLIVPSQKALDSNGACEIGFGRKPQKYGFIVISFHQCLTQKRTQRNLAEAQHYAFYFRTFNCMSVAI